MKTMTYSEQKKRVREWVLSQLDDDLKGLFDCTVAHGEHIKEPALDMYNITGVLKLQQYKSHISLLKKRIESLGG